MSQESHQTTLQEQTQQLLQGPLKHIRGAALAAALLPLASIAAAPAAAQDASCASAGTVCGFVWNDTNNNGIQDAGEPGIAGAIVSLNSSLTSLEIATDDNGFYYFTVEPGSYTLAVPIPVGMQPSPYHAAGDVALDSDGVGDGTNSVAGMTLAEPLPGVVVPDPNTDFGFVASPVTPPPVTSPGTGTPGYWKNHPDAWPVTSIEVGGVIYTREVAIEWLNKVGKDRTVTMFSSLVPAKLNVLIGNDDSCVASTIEAADAWMAKYPLGSNVRASSFAWGAGEPLHRSMDDYNNGMLCAPHRD
jgi:hypothetical protein